MFWWQISIRDGFDLSLLETEQDSVSNSTPSRTLCMTGAVVVLVSSVLCP